MAEAKLNREYAVRVMGVGALMVGICVWSLYDGRVAWPRHNRSAELARPALLATNLTAEAWIERGESGVSALDAVFAEKGARAPSKLIKKLGELKVPPGAAGKKALYEKQVAHVRAVFEGPVYSAHDLKAQDVQAAITLVLGLLAFGAVARKARLRYVADGQGLSGSGFGGQTLAYRDIAKIDWTKWDDKGIAVCRFTSGKQVKLDGWHFAGMDAIVAAIEARRPDLKADKARP